MSASSDNDGSGAAAGERRGSARSLPGPRTPTRGHEPRTNIVLDEPSQRIVVRSTREPVLDTRRPGESSPASRRAQSLDDRSDGGAARLAGVTLQGRYRLEHVLGSGGMGDVYVARHLSLDMSVAVKVMHPHVAIVPEFARRFRREARAASMLHHRNVVQVLDFGADGELLFLVMELLHGESVAEWLLRFDEPPPLAEVQDIMTQLLDAFDAAHSLGIVHRDLKPENLFLTEESDSHRVVKVVDFGLARLDDPTDHGPTLTQDGIVSGTPEYMSPEQCQSLSVGPSTDLYAIGCVLTSLLQLEPPFVAETSMAVMTRQMFWPAPDLERPAGAEPVPPLLERLRRDLLAKSIEKRPRDVGEVRARFAEAMSKEATALRLPARKGGEPSGAREGRVPNWTELSTPPPEPVAASAEIRLALVRLTSSPWGVSPEVCVGLAAHGFVLDTVAPEAGFTEYGFVVVDAGEALEEAVAQLERWRTGGGPKALVCASALDTESMNRFIGAGASDLVSYPIDVDVLLRKVQRMSRRRR